MIKKECQKCKKDISETRRIKYCCKKCSDSGYYDRNKQTYIDNAKRWAKLNPERHRDHVRKGTNKFLTEKRDRFNELMRLGYQRNKDKWNSRSTTRQYLFGLYGHKKLNVDIDFHCKLCQSKKSLELHHEIYPPKLKEIEKAINNKRIYFLCHQCHLSVTAKRFI